MTKWFTAAAALMATCCALADETEDSCRACHRGDLSLEHWAAADLAARVSSMRDGTEAHVVPIPPLSDAEIAALAEALVKPR
jgi:hypothetical protein